MTPEQLASYQKKGYVLKYGLLHPPTKDGKPMPDLFIEMRCFLARGKISESPKWLGKFQHFRNVVDALFNCPESPQKFIWHPWAVTMIEELCRNQGMRKAGADEIKEAANEGESIGPEKEVSFVAAAGCASSGKTNVMGLWGFVNWLCSPTNTMVLVLSAEKSQAKKLIWADIIAFWNACESMGIELPGKLINSTSEILSFTDTGGVNQKAGIILIAAGAKEGSNCVTKVRGYKQERLLLLVDEGPQIVQSLLDAPSNLIKGGRQLFQMMMTGNPASYFDTFGMFVTPDHEDWSRINEGTDRWNMKRGGVCLRFDGEKSPNVLAGKVLYNFLISQADLDRDAIEYGRNSPKYYSMNRGYFTPTGGDRGVYSGPELIFSGAMRKTHEWTGSSKTRIAFLDPSFTAGGDRAMARWADIGEIVGGRMGILFGDWEALQEDVNSKEPRAQQICKAFRDFSARHGVTDPKMAGMDVTGGGEGYADVLSVEWGLGFLRLNFSGAATQQFVGTALKKAEDLFANKVTEIWMLGKSLMRTGQVAGIDSETAKEMTSREMASDDAKKRQRVESKRDMKQRIGKSPDLADCTFGLCFLARERFKLKAVESGTKIHRPESDPNSRQARMMAYHTRKPRSYIPAFQPDENAKGGWAEH